MEVAALQLGDSHKFQLNIVVANLYKNKKNSGIFIRIQLFSAII